MATGPIKPPIPSLGSVARMGRLRALGASLADAKSNPLLQGLGLDLLREVKIMLNRPGTGVVYGSHQASAPGEPPAPDNSDLLNSAAMETLSAAVIVGVGAEYGADLEFGTATIEPRPFMRPAAETVVARWRGSRAVAALRGTTLTLHRGT